MTFNEVKKHPQILEFIKQTEMSLAALSYTEHGLRHAQLVSARAQTISKEIGLAKEQIEIAAVASFCHDMGNFLSRNNHNYIASILFHQLFYQDFTPKELAVIMQAIANHDKEEMEFTNPVSAVVVLADKSDVHRSRVNNMDTKKIDIHDRVNYATKMSRLKINKSTKQITLSLKIDTNYVAVIEYFEIFTARMIYCRKAAQYLKYNFGLVINNFKLL